MTRSEKLSTAIALVSLVVSILALGYTIRSDRAKERAASAAVNYSAFMLGNRVGSAIRPARLAAKLRAEGANDKNQSVAGAELEVRQSTSDARLFAHVLSLAPDLTETKNFTDLQARCSQQVLARHGATAQDHYLLGLAIESSEASIDDPSIAASSQKLSEATKPIFNLARKLALPFDEPEDGATAAVHAQKVHETYRRIVDALIPERM